MRTFIGMVAAITVTAGCVLPGTHYCQVGGHTREYLFPPPYDVSRGNATLRDLGFNVNQDAATSVSFMGGNKSLHLSGRALDFRDPTSNWTLSVQHRSMWRVMNESRGSSEDLTLQARSKALLEAEMEALLPKFETAYGTKHESIADKPAAMMCT